MPRKAEIMAAIAAKCVTPNIWRIGLTHDLAERRRYWGETARESVKYWAEWKADSLSDAQDIEAHFINNGMKSGSGSNLSLLRNVYVYVF